MTRRKLKLFRLFGFEVSLHPSWAIIATIVVWSLSAGLFPQYYGGYAATTYWAMGGAATLGLFFSIVLHELAHSLVARRFGLHMHGITLFIFGGLAEMDAEPSTPKAEGLMAAAGPAMSLLLAVVFYGVLRLGAALGWPTPVNGVFAYLAVTNLILAIFNLVPAFPLDGGRIFRSILWRWKHNIAWATRIAAGAGGAFGLVLIFLGVLQILQGAPLGGLWWVLIGFFLRALSQASRQQLTTRLALENETVSRFMQRRPVAVPSDTTIAEFVDNYVFRFRDRVFPIVDGDRLVGYVSTDLVKQVPKAQWSFRTVGAIGEHDVAGQTVTPAEDAARAMHKLDRSELKRLFVTQEDHLVGTVSPQDLAEFVTLKSELEPGENREN